MVTSSADAVIIDAVVALEAIFETGSYASVATLRIVLTTIEDDTNSTVKLAWISSDANCWLMLAPNSSCTSRLDIILTAATASELSIVHSTLINNATKISRLASDRTSNEMFTRAVGIFSKDENKVCNIGST